jgi:hypothetical protein
MQPAPLPSKPDVHSVAKLRMTKLICIPTGT